MNSTRIAAAHVQEAAWVASRFDKWLTIALRHTDAGLALQAIGFVEEDLKEFIAELAAARAALRGPVSTPDENEEEVVF